MKQASNDQYKAWMNGEKFAPTDDQSVRFESLLEHIDPLSILVVDDLAIGWWYTAPMAVRIA